MAEKLTETFEIRISETLKANIQKLTASEKVIMAEELRKIICRNIHNCSAVYDSSKYQNAD